MPNERKFSSTHVYSLGFWIVGFLLAFAELIYRWDLGELGILTAGIGGVLNIRGFILHMECREREAFSLGEQVERLRSVN